MSGFRKVFLTEKQAKEVVNALEYFVTYMPIKEQSKRNYWTLIKKFREIYNHKFRQVKK